MERLIGHRCGRYAIYKCKMSHDDTDLFEIAGNTVDTFVLPLIVRSIGA